MMIYTPTSCYTFKCIWIPLIFPGTKYWDEKAGHLLTHVHKGKVNNFIYLDVLVYDVVVERSNSWSIL